MENQYVIVLFIEWKVRLKVRWKILDLMGIKDKGFRMEPRFYICKRRRCKQGLVFLLLSDLIGFANPTGDQENQEGQEKFETKQEDADLQSGLPEGEAPEGQDSSPDSIHKDDLRVVRLQQSSLISNGENVHTRSTRTDFSKGTTKNAKTYGTPGPPGWNLLDDFDELTLETRDDNISTTVVQNHRVSPLPAEELSINDYQRPRSLNTLSQDDMTVDAEMGRPPSITNAGCVLQIQQEEREEARRKHQSRSSLDYETGRKHFRDPTHENTTRKESPSNKKRNIESDEIMTFIKNLASSMKQPIPTVKLFDAAVLYDKADYDQVCNFMATLREVAATELKEDLRIELFDSEEFAQSMVMVVADVVERCSVVFVYLTGNCNSDMFDMFCDEAVGISRLGLNNPDVQSGRALTDRRWILKPVHTQHLKRRQYKTPIGLLTLHGVDWYEWPSPYVKDRIVSILNSAIAHRKNRETGKNISISYNSSFDNTSNHFHPNFPTKTKPSISGYSGASVNTEDALSISSRQTGLQRQEPYIPQNTQYTAKRVYTNSQAQVSPFSQSFISPQQFQPGQNYKVPDQRNHQYAQYEPQNLRPAQPYNPYGFVEHTGGHINTQHFQSPQNLQTYPVVPQQNIRYGQHNSSTPLMHPATPLYGPSLMQDQLSYPNHNNAHGMSYQMRPHSLPPQYGTQYASNGTPYAPQGTQYVPQELTNARHLNIHQNPHQIPHSYPGMAHSFNETGKETWSGAEYGSLMMDQRHDTPDPTKLRVVSRLTGKLITNPDLSNNDLEIDTGRKPGKDKGKEKSGTVSESSDETDEELDDSDDDDDDDEGNTDLGVAIPRKGKVINIIGSSVVQLGTNNKASERYKTKRVYQGTGLKQGHTKNEQQPAADKEKEKEEEMKGALDNRMEPCHGAVSRLNKGDVNHKAENPSDQNSIGHTIGPSDRSKKARHVPSSQDRHQPTTSQCQQNTYMDSMDMRPSYRDDIHRTDKSLNQAAKQAPSNLINDLSDVRITPDLYKDGRTRKTGTREMIIPGVPPTDNDRCISLEDNTLEVVVNEISSEDDLFGAGRCKPTSHEQKSRSSPVDTVFGSEGTSHIQTSTENDGSSPAIFSFSHYRASPFTKPSSVSSSITNGESQLQDDNEDVD